MSNNEIITAFDEDDIDLLKIIENQDGAKNQYVVFRNHRNQYYGIHIEYIEEIVRFVPNDFLNNFEQNSATIGTVNLKNQVYGVVDFNYFSTGYKIEFNDRQLLIVLVNKEQKIALLIDEVYDLIRIYENQMTKNSKNNEKYSEVANLTIDNIIVICNLINIDYLCENV